MNIKILLTWLCVAGLSFFVMRGNCAEENHSAFKIIAATERPDGTVDQLKLWTQFEIKSSLFKAEHPKADIFTLKNGNNWKLLRLSDMWPDECQYLLFRLNAKGAWRFCGNIDLTDVHYEMPEHRLQQIGDHTWLVLKHIKGWGTGFLAREEAWYPLNDSFGACELSYLHSGNFTDYTDKNKKNNEYGLVSQECSIANTRPVLELLHSVTGKITDEAGNNHVLYKKDVRTRFVWSEQKMKFEVAKPVADTNIIRGNAK